MIVMAMAVRQRAREDGFGEQGVLFENSPARGERSAHATQQLLDAIKAMDPKAALAALAAGADPDARCGIILKGGIIQETNSIMLSIMLNDGKLSEAALAAGAKIDKATAEFALYEIIRKTANAPSAVRLAMSAPELGWISDIGAFEADLRKRNPNGAQKTDILGKIRAAAEAYRPTLGGGFGPRSNVDITVGGETVCTKYDFVDSARLLKTGQGKCDEYVMLNLNFAICAGIPVESTRLVAIDKHALGVFEHRGEWYLLDPGLGTYGRKEFLVKLGKAKDEDELKAKCAEYYAENEMGAGKKIPAESLRTYGIEEYFAEQKFRGITRKK